MSVCSSKDKLLEVSNRKFAKALKKSLLKLVLHDENFDSSSPELYDLPVSIWVEELKELIDEEFCSTSIIVQDTIITRFEHGEEFQIMIKKSNPCSAI